MTVHLVNPSHLSFGIGVITPRWLFVLAAATPATFGYPRITDDTLEPIDVNTVQPGDVVGVGIHTRNALRGYELGKLARARGATVTFGGVHATLYPDEALSLGGAHAVVKGDGDSVRPLALGDAARGTLQSVYEAGRVDADRFVSARWELLPHWFDAPPPFVIRACMSSARSSSGCRAIAPPHSPRPPTSGSRGAGLRAVRDAHAPPWHRRLRRAWEKRLGARRGPLCRPAPLVDSAGAAAQGLRAAPRDVAGRDSRAHWPCGTSSPAFDES